MMGNMEGGMSFFVFERGEGLPRPSAPDPYIPPPPATAAILPDHPGKLRKT